MGVQLSPPQKGGSLTEQVAWCSLSVGGGGGELLWWAGCQLGVMVLMDLYGELTPSGMSWETLMDGGQVHCGDTLLFLTSPSGGAQGEVTPSNVGCA